MHRGACCWSTHQCATHTCRIHPIHFPRTLECVKLDLWRYEGADVRALAQLPRLRNLVFHFLPVSMHAQPAYEGRCLAGTSPWPLLLLGACAAQS